MHTTQGFKSDVPAWPMAMNLCTSADCGRSGPMVSLHRHKEQVKMYYSLLQPSTTLPVTSCFLTTTCTLFLGTVVWDTTVYMLLHVSMCSVVIVLGLMSCSMDNQKDLVKKCCMCIWNVLYENGSCGFYCIT